MRGAPDDIEVAEVNGVEAPSINGAAFIHGLRGILLKLLIGNCFFDGEGQIPENACVGLYAGRWAVHQKGLDVLLPLIKDRKGVLWLIAPDTPLNLKDIPNARVLENISYEELPQVYAAADFAIQLSRYESFGFFFVESLACYLPVISTPVGVTPEVYNDPLLKDLLVHYGPSGESTSMIPQIHKILDRLKDKNYCESLGTEGRKKVAAEYSLETWKLRMKKYFNQPLKESAYKLSR